MISIWFFTSIWQGTNIWIAYHDVKKWPPPVPTPVESHIEIQHDQQDAHEYVSETHLDPGDNLLNNESSQDSNSLTILNYLVSLYMSVWRGLLIYTYIRSCVASGLAIILTVPLSCSTTKLYHRILSPDESTWGEKLTVSK